MEEITIQTLIHNYLKSYNSFDVEGMTELLHKDIEFRNFSNGVVDTETRGIELFRQLAVQSAKLFSERCQTIREIKISGNMAEIELDYEATLAVDLPNGMRAGDVLKLQGKSVFHIKDGKLIVIEDYS